MNIGKYSTILVSLLLAGILIGTVGIPVIDSIANETHSVSNSGAQWVRMAYVEDDSDYSFTVHMNDNDTVTITNGDSVQTGPTDDIILYADEYHTLFIKDGVLCTIGDSFNDYISGGPTVDGYDVTITRTNGTVTKTDRFGSNWGEPSWAYVPITGGIYSSFGANAVPLHRYSEEVVAVGTYAGVYAGQMGVVDVSYDYGLVMDADVTADYINSIQWVLESELTEDEPLNVLPFDPNDIDPLDPGVIVDPFDPGQIQPIDIDPIPIDPGNQIMSVPTPTYTDGDWGYDLDANNVATIVSYSGAGGSVTIPATVGGYTVTGVGKGGSGETVFNTTLSVTSLTISSGITRINKYAFQNCTGITANITFPSGIVRIDDYAFNGCTGLTGITLPDTLNRLGGYAFKGCTGLTGDLTVPADTYYYGSNCFENCTGLTGTLYYNVTTSIPAGQSQIFKNCGFTSIVIGNGVEGFPITAFENCLGLTSVPTFPASFKYLAGGCFKGCTNITGNVIIPDTIVAYGTSSYLPGQYQFQGCGITSVEIRSNANIAHGMFKDCTSLTDVNITGIPSQLGNEAFSGCTSLKNIPSLGPITVISDDAFRNCYKLEGSINLMYATSIKSGAFWNAGRDGNGMSVLFGEGLTKIEQNAFRECNLVGQLILPSTITDISGTNIFYNTTNLESLVVLCDTAPTYNIFHQSGVKYVLNLSSQEITTTSWGMNAEEVQDHIEADNYLAIVSYSETVQKTGSVYDMINLIPLVITMGVVLFAVYCFIRK